MGSFQRYMALNTAWRLVSSRTARQSQRVCSQLSLSPACQAQGMSTSVHQDTLLDAIESKKRSRKSKEFDTLGTWDTRINVEINEDATLRTGHIVPNIDVTMIGHASVQ